MVDSDEFYKSLKDKLQQQHQWPLLYMFKFIVPSENSKIAMVMNLFNENAQVSLKHSKSGKFTSITAKEVMINPNEIIERYRKAENIEGLIAL